MLGVLSIFATGVDSIEEIYVAENIKTHIYNLPGINTVKQVLSFLF